MRHYILDQYKLAIPCDLMTWAEFFGNIENRRVALDMVDDIQVSTVFLGLDHRFGPGDPLLFETLVFLPDDTGTMDRYSTWAQAAAGHERITSMLRREHLDANATSSALLRELLAKEKQR